MKLNCGLSVWQKPKDFFSPILSFLWKEHNKRLRGQTIDTTATIPNWNEPNQEKSVIWNWAMHMRIVSRVSFILHNNYNIGWLYFGLYENILHLPWMISNSPFGSLDIIHGACSIFSYNPQCHPILYNDQIKTVLLVHSIIIFLDKKSNFTHCSHTISTSSHHWLSKHWCLHTTHGASLNLA